MIQSLKHLHLFKYTIITCFSWQLSHVLKLLFIHLLKGKELSSFRISTLLDYSKWTFSKCFFNSVLVDHDITIIFIFKFVNTCCTYYRRFSSFRLFSNLNTLRPHLRFLVCNHSLRTFWPLSRRSSMLSICVLICMPFPNNPKSRRDVWLLLINGY